jgi:hypothetical protein
MVEVSWWYGDALPELLHFLEEDHPKYAIHAGEWETALVLLRAPELVDRTALNTLPPKQGDTQDFGAASRRGSDLSRSGSAGGLRRGSPPGNPQDCREPLRGPRKLRRRRGSIPTALPSLLAKRMERRFAARNTLEQAGVHMIRRGRGRAVGAEMSASRIPVVVHDTAEELLTAYSRQQVLSGENVRINLATSCPDRPLFPGPRGSVRRRRSRSLHR